MVRSFFDPALINQLMPKQGFSGAPVFDLKLMMETQRKNAQAMSEIMQLSFEGAQHAFSRQAELVGRMVQDNSNYASSILTEGTPEQKVQRQADLVRKSYEASVAGAREVSDIISKSNEEAAEIINRRITASLTEFKAAFDRDGKLPLADKAVKETVKQTVKTVKVANRSAKKARRRAA